MWVFIFKSQQKSKEKKRNKKEGGLLSDSGGGGRARVSKAACGVLEHVEALSSWEAGREKQLRMLGSWGLSTNLWRNHQN